MVRLRELPEHELYGPGHRACTGCGEAMSVRMALKASRGPAVIVNVTGCIEIFTTPYPYTAWRIPYAHVAFENAGAVASGVEAGYKALARRGAWDKKVDVIAVAGDGGTFDIGIQALSGALERGHDFTYICCDNEAYMNTGIQRSGATPRDAATTTSPAGRVVPGKPEWKKDLIGICVAHGIKYAATATVAYWNDYITKVGKALAVDGPAVIHVLTPCPLGWRYNPSDTVRYARLAVQTCYFPLYEVENGVYKLSMRVSKPLPVEEFLKGQGRYSHLFRPELRGEIDVIQKGVDANWRRILALCGEKA
ncbi:MAG: thiamine pyrophosphate-dependent enzyme [Candidatus Bathyarchaeia archaeon]